MLNIGESRLKNSDRVIFSLKNSLGVNMNMLFNRHLPIFVSVMALTVMGSGLSAQAETIDSAKSPNSAKLGKQMSNAVSMPGTAATSSAALTQVELPTSRAAKSSGDVTVPRVAQADTNNQPSPGFDTTPTPADSAPTTPAPTTPTTAVNFTDVDPSYWAYPFIQGLAGRNVIAGFPDGSFRSEQPVTRAEFAAMLQKAFNPTPVRQLSPGGFTDVPTDYWAASAIRAAYEAGFLAGYPNNTFQPDQEIPKVQAIAGLANGLNLTPSGDAAQIISTYYTDSAQIPSYALNQVAAATQANLVVNYPDVKTLNPQLTLTRAEAAAHLYQALVRLGQVEPLPATVAAANYIVGGPGSAISQAPPTTPEQTKPEEETKPEETETNIEPGRATRGGSSYLGVAANFGLSGDTALGEDVGFTVLSKIGLTRTFSARPSVVIQDDPVVLIPVTYDFNFQSAEAFDEGFRIAPYLGAGVGIRTGDDSDVGFLLTGGVDVPITGQFTATAGVNAVFGDDTDVGLLIGVGYNFTGF
jgi:hypothetical protein